MCSYGQLSEVQMLGDLDLDLGSGQGHINVHSTCRTTSLPNHVAVASCSTEIWPFEFLEISALDEVWTVVIAFPEGNSTRKPRKGAAVIAASMHGFASFRKFKSPVNLTLTLDRVKVTSTYIVRVGLPAYPTIWLYLHAVPKYVAIWMSWNIDIPWSMNCSDTFPRKEFENRAPTGCRPGPILSTSTVSFELHAKVAEEIDLETCSYEQLSDVQMVRDLDLNLGSGQGHGNIYSKCRTTYMLNHVTVASRTTEIRPFEFREISTFGQVWTLVIVSVSE